MTDENIKNYIEEIQRLINNVKNCENQIDVMMTLIFIYSIKLYMVNPSIQQEIISGMIPKLIADFENIGIPKVDINRSLKIAKSAVENNLDEPEKKFNV